jgi:hypothetical protein
MRIAPSSEKFFYVCSKKQKLSQGQKQAQNFFNSNVIVMLIIPNRFNIVHASIQRTTPLLMLTFC